ncbi:MAG: hypothetical protein KF850_41260, partial [Labilithrix sp.]|nr:hypothetical protein [Labilithrix sp.]
VLGLLAALLVRDAPRRPAAPDTTAAAADPETPLPDPTPQPLLPSGVSTTTPIIDMGDLEEAKPGQAAKPRVKRAPQASQAPRPQAAATADKNGDLAGPLKVWK